MFSWECTDFLKQQSSHPRCSVKKVLLNISQNSLENTCAEASLVSLESTLLKRDSNTYYPVNITKFLRAPILKNIWERLHLKQLF